MNLFHVTRSHLQNWLRFLNQYSLGMLPSLLNGKVLFSSLDYTRINLLIFSEEKKKHFVFKTSFVCNEHRHEKINLSSSGN